MLECCDVLLLPRPPVGLYAGARARSSSPPQKNPRAEGLRTPYAARGERLRAVGSQTRSDLKLRGVHISSRLNSNLHIMCSTRDTDEAQLPRTVTSRDRSTQYAGYAAPRLLLLLFSQRHPTPSSTRRAGGMKKKIQVVSLRSPQSSQSSPSVQ